MPLTHLYEDFTLVSGGATFTIDPNRDTTIYRIKGTVASPTGNNAFNTTSTPVQGTMVTFRYVASFAATGSVSVVIFGQTIPITLATKNHTITAFWDGSAWDVQFIPDLDQTGTLPYDVLPPDEGFTAVNVFGGSAPAFANTNYSSSGTVALGFRKRGDKRIEFRGTVTDAAGTNAQLFTLPAGYRPGRDKKYIISGEVSSSGAFVPVTLTINGTSSGTPGQINIAGLSAASKIFFDGFVAFREDE